MSKNRKRQPLTTKEAETRDYVLNSTQGQAAIRLLLTAVALDRWAESLLVHTLSGAPSRLSGFEMKRIFKALSDACNKDLVDIPDTINGIVELVNNEMREVITLYKQDIKDSRTYASDYLRRLGAETAMPGLDFAASCGYGAILLYRGDPVSASTAAAMAVSEVFARNIPVSLFAGDDVLSNSLRDSKEHVVDAYAKDKWKSCGVDSEFITFALNQRKAIGVVVAPQFLDMFGGTPTKEMLQTLHTASKEHFALFIGVIPSECELVSDPAIGLFVKDAAKQSKMNEETQMLETFLAIDDKPVTIGIKQ